MKFEIIIFTSYISRAGSIIISFDIKYSAASVDGIDGVKSQVLSTLSNQGSFSVGNSSIDVNDTLNRLNASKLAYMYTNVVLTLYLCIFFLIEY